MPTVSGGTVLDATTCVDIAEGAGGLGDSCQRDWGSGIDDCGAGLMCWDVDTESGGFCAPFCTGSPDEPNCPEDRACLQYPPTFEQAPVCLSFCDPTGSAPCGNALSCLPVHPNCTPPECFPMEAPASFFCLPQTANTVNQSGWPCDEGLCRADMICAPQGLVPTCMGGEPGCCTPYCDLDAPDCTEGTCQSVFDLDAATQGLEHVGACLL